MYPINDRINFSGGIREASKKSGPGGTRTGNHGKPGHHGWKRQHGSLVTFGTTLAFQYNLRFCPGLNVGLGKRGQLYAKVPGKVVVTCEKTNFNPDHAWVKKWYPNRQGVMYKKYFNVLPEPEHQRFKLIDQV